MLSVILVAVTSYLLGSIPFSYLAGKAFRGLDLREHGSGNLGAANAFRILGSKIAVGVLVGDIAKGFIPVHFAYLANSVSSAAPPVEPHWLMLIAALVTVLGHMFSVFIRFSGGKGIATSAGAFMALSPWAFLGAFLTWACVFTFTRIVSVASLSAAVMLPACVYLAGRFDQTSQHWSVLVLSCLIAAVVVAKHRSNIQRLLGGTESALARKKK